MFRKWNKEKIISVKLKCDPFAIWVSFHELISNRNTKMGRNVRILIIEKRLFICAIKKAFNITKPILTKFDHKVFGNK